MMLAPIHSAICAAASTEGSAATAYLAFARATLTAVKLELHELELVVTAREAEACRVAAQEGP